ncbi:MAG: Fic family protein [Acidobacteriia bacterium]|nr:Fic family protein [Terriglobia bacterium]
MFSAQYVQYIHDNLVMVMWPDSDSVRSGGCRDLNLLESAVARPFQSAFGVDAYPTILDKAVALFHSLNSNHPFHDGNKRTAIIALDDFLVANGYLQDLTVVEVYNLAMQTASYNERGISHEESLLEIKRALTEVLIPLSAFRKGMGSDPLLQQMYKDCMTVRRRVRNNPLNRLV